MLHRSSVSQGRFEKLWASNAGGKVFILPPATGRSRPFAIVGQQVTAEHFVVGLHIAANIERPQNSSLWG